MSIASDRGRSVINRCLDMDQWWEFKQMNILLREIQTQTELADSSVRICSNMKTILWKWRRDITRGLFKTELISQWVVPSKPNLVGGCLQLAQIFINEVSVKTESTCKSVFIWSETNHMYSTYRKCTPPFQIYTFSCLISWNQIVLN